MSGRRPHGQPASTTRTRQWQHPYVDVFKVFKVGDAKAGAAEFLGDVKRVLDPDIGKAAFRIAGNVAASNCIHIPRGIKSTTQLTAAPSRTVARGSLALTGRFVYFELKSTVPKFTTFHLDVLTRDKFVYRLSFSNVFRAQRLVGQVAQIPTRFRHRWTVFAVDVPALLESVSEGAATAADYHCVKGIQLCASMTVRNVYTSDTLYTADTLPRDLALPTRGGAWEDRYEFLWVPAEPDSDLAPVAVAAGRPPLRQLTSPPRGALGGDDLFKPSPRLSPEAKARSKSKSPVAQGLQGARRSRSSSLASVAGGPVSASPPPPATMRVSAGPTPPPQPLHEYNAVSLPGPTGAPPSGADLSEPSVWEADADAEAAEAESPRHRAPQASGAAVLREADSILRAAGVSPPPAKPGSIAARKWTLGAASTIPAGVMSVMGAPGEAAGAAARREQAAVLSPEPIMALSHVVGVAGSRPGCILWSADGEEVVFPCANLVVAMRHEDAGAPTAASPRRTAPYHQRHFMGHTADVCSLTLSHDGSLLVTGQAGPQPTIRVWDFASGDCLAVLGGHASELGTLSMSLDDTLLVAPGRDSHNRLLLIVWDVSRVADGHHPIVARQVADFPVTRIRFSPYDASKLASCGRENVRFWRIKRGHLPGCPVILNQYARGCEFTDLAFESSYGASGATGSAVVCRLFVASAVGTLLQVNYDTRELECVYRLHDSGIASLSINEGFCVTASADNFLRVWPLDFSDFFLEARLEGAVTSAAVSPDGLKISVGTASGSVGVLDIASHAYATLLRSHTEDVLAVAVSAEAHGELATVSMDGTIRVWNAASGDQLYEFTAPGEVSRAVAYHPTAHVLVCGFENGFVRVFDIPSASVMEEYRQHRGPVRAVAFTPDGEFLFSAAGDGHVCMYDASGSYSPLKVLSADLPPDVVDAGAALAVTNDGRTLAAAFSPGTPSGGGGDAFNAPPPSQQYRGAADVPPAASPIIMLVDPSSLALRRTLAMPVYPNRTSRAPTSRMLPSALSLPVSATGLVATLTGPGVRSDGHMGRGGDERTYKGLPAGGDADTPPAPIVTQLLFTPDGSQLVATTSNSRILRWTVATGALAREVRSTHSGPVCAADTSPNGTFLLTGGDDHVVKVWDLAMRGPPPPLFQAFVGHAGPIRAVNFLPGGKGVVTVGGGKGVFFLWAFRGDAGAAEPLPRPSPPRLAEHLPGGDHPDAYVNDTLAPYGSDELHADASAFVFESEGVRESLQAPSLDDSLAPPPSRQRSPSRSAELGLEAPKMEPILGDGNGFEAEDSPEVGALPAPETQPLHPEPSAVPLSEDEEGGDEDEDEDEDEEEGIAALVPQPHPHPVSAVPASVSTRSSDIWEESDGEGGSSEYPPDAPTPDADSDSEPEPDTYISPHLTRVLAMNPGVRGGLMWHPGTGMYGYAAGSSVMMEDLASGQQSALDGLSADVVCAALSPQGDCAAAGSLGTEDASQTTLATWRRPQGSGRWAFSDELSFGSGGAEHPPVLCIAFSPDGSRLAAIARPGVSPMRVTVAVWDVLPGGSPTPLVSRTVVLASTVMDDNTSIVSELSWASPSQFVVVGTCGAVEFKVVEQLESKRGGTRAEASFSMRYRAVIAPDLLKSLDGSPTHLTCVAFRTETVASSGGGAPPQHTPLNEFVAGDASGGLWVVAPDAAADGHSIVQCRPSWGGDTDAAAVHAVTWRGDVLVGASAAGRMVAWGLSHAAGADGHMPTRGTLVLDSAIAHMHLDAAGVEGLALTESGSVWFTRWGVEPCRLLGAHTGRVSCLASSEGQNVMLSASGEDGTARVWETDQWEPVLALGTEGAHPSCMATTVLGDDSPMAAAGFADGSLRAYGLTSGKPASSVSPHKSDVTAVAWIGTDDRMALVSGDSRGRIFLAPIGDDTTLGPVLQAPIQLDHMHIADDVAVSHKYHAITSLHSSPFDPYMFVVASANGRVSVWSTAPSGSAVLMAAVTNNAVGGVEEPWVPLVPPGTSTDAATFACFSPVQPSVVVCVSAMAGYAQGVHFVDLQTGTSLQQCAFPDIVTGVSPLVLQASAPDLSFVALTTDAAVYLLCCAAGSLGDVHVVVPVGATAVAAAPTTRSPLAHVVTAVGGALQVWRLPEEGEEGDE